MGAFKLGLRAVIKNPALYGRDSAVGFGKQLLSDKYLRQESFFNKKSIVLRSIGNLLAV